MSACLALCLLATAAPAQKYAPPTKAALHELDLLMADYVERQKVLGAELLVIHGKRVILHEAYGWRDKEDELPMIKHTIFNIRSMTKPLTGAAAQILADEGKLDLEAPVGKYLPAFDNEKCGKILVRHLLEHRSGLPLSAFQTSVDEFENLQAIVDAVAEAGPSFEPGSEFSYSDAGSDTLGAVVAAVSGEDIDVFIQRRILQPLKMKDSFYTPTADDPRVERMASLYGGRAGEWAQFWKPDGKSMYPFAWGSQTLYSTPLDYARFLRMWMKRGMMGEERLLSEAAMKRTFAPVSRMRTLGSNINMPTGFPDMETRYGQMSVLYTPIERPKSTPLIIGHSGSDGTLAYAWPERDLIVCMFTQSRGNSLLIRFESDIHRLLIDPTLNKPAPSELQPLLGIYLPEVGPFANQEIEVLMQNGCLSVDVPGQMVFELTEPDEEGWRGLKFDPRARISFELDDLGKATAMLFWNPGQAEPERIPRGRAADKKQTQLPEIHRRYLGVYWDKEGQAEVQFVDFEGSLTARHPAMTTPLKFTGPDEEGFWTLKLNPSIRIRFVEDEKGVVTAYEVHAQGAITPRKRLRDLDS